MRKIATTLASGLLAAAIGTAALPSPAFAGGSLSFSYAPTRAEDARALQTGLRLYSLYNGFRNGASIKQRGRRNAAGIAQTGSRNHGAIYQDGSGHSATLTQNGNGNSYGIFQFGRNTSADVAQNGDGRAGATFQFGW